MRSPAPGRVLRLLNTPSPIHATVELRFPTVQLCAQRAFAASSKRPAAKKNQIYDPVRSQDQLSTALSASSSAHQPLITVWTASWERKSLDLDTRFRQILTLRCGEAEGGVGYAAVEYDSADIAREALALRYNISTIPAVLTFAKGEPVTGSLIVAGKAASAKNNLLDNEDIRQYILAATTKDDGGGGGGQPTWKETVRDSVIISAVLGLFGL